MSVIDKYYRSVLPPLSVLTKIASRHGIPSSIVRTICLHSQNPWYIYDFQFTLMLIESSTSQLLPTLDLLAHMGIGEDSTHFKRGDKSNVCVDLAIRKNRSRELLDQLEIGDKIDIALKSVHKPISTFWGYSRTRFAVRSLLNFAKSLRFR